MFFVLSASLCFLQVQKKNYREEKKRATKELLSTITDPSVIVMADWLKVGQKRQHHPKTHHISTIIFSALCWSKENKPNTSSK